MTKHDFRQDDLTAAGLEYAAHLRRKIHSLIITAAQRGWTPDDLRHTLTSQIDHLLFQVLPEVVADVPPATRDAWRRQCHAASDLNLSTAALEHIADSLRRLLPLRDHEFLADAHALEASEQAFAAFSPEQRKAHHRITALLKKAESTSFEGEADALVAKVQQLRQRYRVETTLDRSSDHSGDLIAQRVYLHSPWIKHQFSLLHGVAEVNSCATLLLTRNGICTILGAGDDVRYVHDLFRSLNRQRAHFMRTSAGAHEAAAAGETAAYRRSFLIAYAARITVLLQDASQQVITADSLAAEYALPALTARGQTARTTLTGLYPGAGTIHLSSRHLLGHRDGVAAAHRSHLGGETNCLDQMSA